MGWDWLTLVLSILRAPLVLITFQLGLTVEAIHFITLSGKLTAKRHGNNWTKKRAMRSCKYCLQNLIFYHGYDNFAVL